MSIVVKQTSPDEASIAFDGTARGDFSIEYTIYGAINAIDACNQLQAWLLAEGVISASGLLYVGGTLSGLMIRSIKAKGNRGVVTSDNTRAYVLDVAYSSIDNHAKEVPSDPEEPPGAEEEEWDIQSESSRIFLPQSISVHRATAGTGFNPDIKLIGDKLNGDAAEGVEWPSGVTNFTVPQLLPTSLVTFELLNQLELMVGRLNAAEFRGRDAECVQYLGATKRKRGAGQTLFMHRFFSRAPKTIEVDGFTDINAAGFDYAWPIPLGKVSADQLTQGPNWIAVAKVGVTANFGVFGV